MVDDIFSDIDYDKDFSLESVSDELSVAKKISDYNYVLRLIDYGIGRRYKSKLNSIRKFVSNLQMTGVDIVIDRVCLCDDAGKEMSEDDVNNSQKKCNMVVFIGLSGEMSKKNGFRFLSLLTDIDIKEIEKSYGPQYNYNKIGEYSGCPVYRSKEKPSGLMHNLKFVHACRGCDYEDCFVNVDNILIANETKTLCNIDINNRAFDLLMDVFCGSKVKDIDRLYDDYTLKCISGFVENCSKCNGENIFIDAGMDDVLITKTMRGYGRWYTIPNMFSVGASNYVQKLDNDLKKCRVFITASSIILVIDEIFERFFRGMYNSEYVIDVINFFDVDKSDLKEWFSDSYDIDKLYALNNEVITRLKYGNTIKEDLKLFTRH